MRETKFRGKSDLSIEESEEAGVPHKNGWIVGNLIGEEKFPVIVGPIVDCSDEYFNTEWWASVITESVGQYTGLKDKHNIAIYEGDILKNEEGKIGYVSFLVQEVGYVVVLEKQDYRLGHRNTAESYEIAQGHERVGNIYDNPELLEVEK